MKKRMFSIIILGMLFFSFLSINTCAESERILEQETGDYYIAANSDIQYGIGDLISIIIGIATVIIFISYLISVYLWRGIKKKDKTLDRLFSSAMTSIIISLLAVIINSMWV